MTIRSSRETSRQRAQAQVSGPHAPTERSGALRRWHLGPPGFLGWLQGVLGVLGFGVGLTAAVIGLPGNLLHLPAGFGAASWVLLLILALIRAVRLSDHLLAGQVFGAGTSLAGLLGNGFLLLGMAASRGLKGLLGVFSLFLAAGEILRLVELRSPPPPAWLSASRPVLTLRLRLWLSGASLAGFLLLVLASFR